MKTFRKDRIVFFYLNFFFRIGTVQLGVKQYISIIGQINTCLGESAILTILLEKSSSFLSSSVGLEDSFLRLGILNKSFNAGKGPTGVSVSDLNK